MLTSRALRNKNTIKEAKRRSAGSAAALPTKHFTNHPNDSCGTNCVAFVRRDLRGAGGISVEGVTGKRR